jgi:AcrR family transcriptional regulator
MVRVRFASQGASRVSACSAPRQRTIRVSFGFSMPPRANARSPRNQPRQSRSRATVELILDAAVRIFEREGADAATTSRVAEVAGVSVGTLYQYFANRDAILDALQDREFERATLMMQRVLAVAGRASEREVATSVVVELLRLYRAAPALHRVLALEGLRVTPPERVLAFDLRVVGIIKNFLLLDPTRIRPKQLDTAAFVIYQSVRATMLAYLLESPAGVDDAVLVSEITELIVGYLVGRE